MTQELIDKLIAHYEWCAKEIEGMEWVAIDEFLYKNYIDKGICYCSRNKFSSSIHNDKWVNGFGSAYWTFPAWIHTTKSSVLSALQFRIDRMKTFNP